MAADNLGPCLQEIFGHEGGFTDDPNDRGNWTGGARYAGDLKGTKYGVSAMSYPQLDIKNLTLGQAAEIYQRDFWTPARGDELPLGVDLCVLDSAINSGGSRAAQWLQRAMAVKVTGKITADTALVAKAWDPHVIIDRMCDDRLNFLKGLDSWKLYGKGWTTRVANVRKKAHSWAKATAPVAVPQPLPIPVPATETVTQSFLVTVTGKGPFQIAVTAAEEGS